MSGWPDFDNPGAPLNPERDGVHWFKVNINVEDIVFVAEWDAHEKFYTWSCGEAGPVRCAAAGWTYLGPCLTPAEVDDLRAENARLREALEGMLSGSKYDEAADWWVLIRTPTSRELSAARAALDSDGQKERRAKALSDLAEMDADLLDIDPEMKP